MVVNSWFVRFALGSLLFVGAIMFIVWVMGAFDDAALGFHGIVALLLGSGFSIVLGVALMGLVFYSNRSGQDERADGSHQNGKLRGE